MIKIWLLILAGVVIVPLISSFTKELEERLTKFQEDKYEADETGKPNKKEDIEFTIKFLRYTVMTLFIVITIIMIRFTAQIITSK